MTITQHDITALESRINTRLRSYNAEFVMTIHFSMDRLNDLRNNPPITLVELESIFDKVINQHIEAIIALNDKDTFNIRCMTSHINMPCAVVKEPLSTGGRLHKNIVITVMRKETFVAKDPIEFQV